MKKMLKVALPKGRLGEKAYKKNEKFTALDGVSFDVKKGELQDKIPTLEAFLKEFADKELSFAIELKVDGIEQEVVDLLCEYGVKKQTIITSFNLERLKKVKEYSFYTHVGYLTKMVDDALIQTLCGSWIDEICPHASIVSAEKVKAWHRIGFDVRAWGVGSEETMRLLCEAGVDGMTVNTPDVLLKYVTEQNV